MEEMDILQYFNENTSKEEWEVVQQVYAYELVEDLKDLGMEDKKEFNLAEAQKELELSKVATKDVYFIAKDLVRGLLNADDFMDGEKVDRFGLAEYMTGAIVVALTSKDKILEEAEIKSKKFNMDVVDEIVEDVN